MPASHQALTRKFDTDLQGRLLFATAFLFACFQLFTAAYAILPSQIVRAMHVGFLLLLGLPLIAQQGHRLAQIAGWSLGVAGMGVAVYQWINYNALLLRAGDPLPIDMGIGILGIIVLFLAAWRIMGPALPIIASMFLAYCVFGQYLPAPLNHRGYGLDQIVDHMAYGTEGIYGIPTLVSSTYIFLFILFGAFLERAGMILLFTDVALALVGQTKGGAAKVAITTSALMGTISGSGVANVVTTGQFTIPLMKRFGYRAAFAGGVEATASMGGQIMPPVMGAVAFIMAETIDVPYATIVKAAIIPALLYFVSAFIMVHLEAEKHHLTGIPAAERPSAMQALRKRWYLILPLIALVYLLFSGYTPLFAGTMGLALTVMLILGGSVALGLPSAPLRILFWIGLGFIAASFLEWGVGVLASAIAMLIAWNVISKGGRETLTLCRDSLAEGAKTALPVGVACALVGIIIGTMTLTGAATTFGQFVVSIGETSLFLSLLLTMLICLVLGMGIPTIPNYIITSSLACPALLDLGVPLIVSHMFVFYFGILADLTPPVALAAFAAAPIARESGFKISLQAVRIALAGFVIPFMAVYAPALMLQDGGTLATQIGYIPAVLFIIFKALIAITLWAVAATGHALTPLNIIERIAATLIALTLVAALPLTDEIGLALTVGFTVWQVMKHRQGEFA